MESYSIFRDLAIIIIFAKVFGIIARKYYKIPFLDRKSTRLNSSHNA